MEIIADDGVSQQLDVQPIESVKQNSACTFSDIVSPLTAPAACWNASVANFMGHMSIDMAKKQVRDSPRCKVEMSIADCLAIEQSGQFKAT